MEKVEKIAEILTENLTREELALLCDSWDDGSLADVFREVLIPKDIVKWKEILNKKKG